MISTSMLSREQVEQPDLFEFMSNVMGYTIMHPGALSATDRLAQMVHVGPEMSVLDVGSGKGISALHLARKYGCKVMGVDISERFVDQANDAARRTGIKAAFRVGDALDLPFADGEFDVVLAQAVLIMLGSRVAQERAVEEMVRVTRPGGYIGGIELGWKREPPPGLIRTATARMCKNCVPNMRTIAGWRDLFSSKGVRELQVLEENMGYQMMWRAMAPFQIMRGMFLILINPAIRKRMMGFMKVMFREGRGYFGYGIFAGRR